MITPALSAAEWEDDPNAVEVEWRIGGLRYVVASEVLEDGTKGISLCYPHGESIAGTWIPPEIVPKIAALCLHGRISWEMVKAIRRIAVVAKAVSAMPTDDDLANAQAADFVNYVMADMADQAIATADLLESLLPPEQPTV